MAFLIVIPSLAAQCYGVTLPMDRLLVCIPVAIILSVATPPVPGAGLTACSLMFMQMGIPLDVLPFAMALNVLLDPVITVGNVCTQIYDVTRAAKHLNMLDVEVLRKE